MDGGQSRAFFDARLVLSEGPSAFKLVPGLISRAVELKVWEHHEDDEGRTFQSFRHMLEYKHPRGFNTPLSYLLNIVSPEGKEGEEKEDCMKCERLIFDAVAPIGQHGGARQEQGDNVTLTDKRGNSRTYTILKLQRDAPELADSVLNGEISASEAAVKMGYRKVKTPYEQLEKWWGKASPAERKKFKYNHFRKEVT